MRNFMSINSNNLKATFENNEENFYAFERLVSNAANGIYEDYDKETTQKKIRKMFDNILGINWETATPMQRRQAWRANGKEIYTVIEDVIADKLVSGWGEDPFFMQFVESKNLALGDKNEFYVNDNSIMTVSKFAGNNHDIVRQKVGFGKSFTVETSWYAIKCYADFEQFRSGRIDFSAMIDKMYTAIEKYRKDAIYTAFMSAPSVLPSDLVIDCPVTSDTVENIATLAEEVKAATGKDVMFVGTKVALAKLAKTINYNMWSEKMKDEYHTTGELGVWEGYQLMAVPRVNEINSRKEITDNTKILIVPIDPEFKPIKHVSEGDVIYTESGMNGEKKDMTMDAEIMYKEGISVVINQIYGIVNITRA